MAATDSDVKECWYVVLGVERTATAEEIRSAYRKEALKWHPDKIQQSGATPAECQEATVRFQKLAQAYEVLSDPVERAWYDKYRSEILSSGTASKDFEFNVFSFFSPSAFSGFGDTRKGFYNVYSDVFAKIHQKEQAFAKAYGVGPIGEAPEIGNLSSPISEVEEFYKFWTGFSSMKDFSWCDEYQVSQAPNRKLRRLMEEENAKIRKRNRREFNDAVRDLATFVKKRDKRWLDYKLEQQRLQKEKEQQFKAKQLKIQQEKLAKARAFQEQEWMKTPADALDDEDDANHDVNEGSYDWKGGGKKKSVGEDLQEFFCIICNKRFRSEKQWGNHEKSKKHIERASVLRASFLEDDKVVEAASSSADLEDSAGLSAENLNDVENGGFENREQEGSADSEENSGGRTRRSAERPHRPTKNQTAANSESSGDDSEGIQDGDEDDLLAEMMSRMAGPQADVRSSTRNEDSHVPEGDSMQRVADGSSSELDDGNADTTHDPYSEKDDEDTVASMLKSRRKQVRFASDVKDNEEETESSPQNEEREERASGGRGSRKKKSNSEKQRKAAGGRYDGLQSELSSSSLENPSGTKVVSSDVDTDEPPAGESQKSQPPPVKKKVQRGPKKSKNKGGVNHSANMCDTCGEDFDSRTQLFRHLSVTNHATLKSH